MEGLKMYFNRHIYLIVTIWVLGVALFMLRLLSSISYVYYLKSKMNFPADEYWQELLDGLAAKVNVQKGIELVESALVRSPMVIGHLKPVILFPIGAINRLNPNEVEAILAHELAHVMRNDYALNIIQSVIEALFYFHPAVWWISAQIRAERENCCDDVAIELCGNSMTYAKSLVSVQEMAYYSPQMAMAFAGKSGKNQLLMRVQRVLNQPQNKTNIREKLITTCLLVALMVGLAFGSNRLERRQNDLSDITNVDSMDNSTENVDSTSENGQNTEGGNFLMFVNKKGQLDSLPIEGEVKDGKYNFSDNTQEIDLTVKNRQVVQFNINGLEVASADIPKFAKVINRIVAPPTPTPPTPPSPDAFPNGNANVSFNDEALHVNGFDNNGKPIVLTVDKNGLILNGDGVSMNISGDETTYEEDAKPVKGLVDYHKNGKISSIVGNNGTIQNYDEKGDLTNIVKPNGVIKDYKNRKLVSKNSIYPSVIHSQSSGENTYEEDAKPINGKRSYHPNGQIMTIVGSNRAIQRFNDRGELEVVIKSDGTVKRYQNKQLQTVTNSPSGGNFPKSNNISRKTNDPYNTLHLKADNGFSYVNFTLNGSNIWKCYKNGTLLGDLTLTNNKVYYNGQIATSEQLKQFGLLWYNSSLNPLTGGFQIVNNNINGNTNRHYDGDESIDERVEALKDRVSDMKEMLSDCGCQTREQQWFQWANARLAAQNALIMANKNERGLNAIEGELNSIQKQFDRIKAGKKSDCSECDEAKGYSYSYGTDERSRKDAQKMAQRAQRDAAHAQRDAETARRDAETAQRDAETAKRDAQSQARGNNYSYSGYGDSPEKSEIGRTLRADKLINEAKAVVIITAQQTTINGKAISATLHKKYLAIHDRYHGAFGDGGFLKLEYNTEGAYNSKNYGYGLDDKSMIGAELTRDNMIKEGKTTFFINGQQMKINDKVMPSIVHEKYLKLLNERGIGQNGATVIFDYNTTSKSTITSRGGYTSSGKSNGDDSGTAKSDLFKNLIKDGYIQLNKKCKVAFDNDELIVDGQELDNAIFKRYKADFEKKLGRKAEYSIKFKGVVTAVKADGVDMTGEFNISID
jgi:beta-lactamase regulating signal transducer with metallopeptidase domain